MSKLGRKNKLNVESQTKISYKTKAFRSFVEVLSK